MANMHKEDSDWLRRDAATLSETAQNDPQEDYTFPDGVVVKAIRHEHLRTELLEQAEARCRWTHPQPHGVAPDDRTAPMAFPVDQLDWGWTRELYPPINFVLEKREYKHPDYHVQDWYHDGRLILDLEGKPMKKLLHLPDTCSSNIPGGHIEALMRFDDRTRYSDIRGRMPPAVTIERKSCLHIRSLKGTNALSASAKVYREAAGCLSTKAEIATVREPTIGSRPNQARKRSSSDEAREKREQNIKKRKAAASAERTKAAISNRNKDNHNTDRNDDVRHFEAHLRSDDDEEPIDEDKKEEGTEEEDVSETRMNEPLDKIAKNYETMFTDVRDPRVMLPSSAEEVLAIRQACSATLIQFKSILGTDPILVEPHSYAYQIGTIRQQFDEKFGVTYPERKDEAPTLLHLTGWAGGIEDWRTATYFDGEAEYHVEEDGRVGSRIPSNDTPPDDSVEHRASEAPVIVGNNHVNLQPGSSAAPGLTNTSGTIEDASTAAGTTSGDGERRCGSGGLLDW
ncbi:MAG: hypothetical protein Q9209_002985 [Squamulea sp. 1 TL-2023]